MTLRKKNNQTWIEQGKDIKGNKKIICPYCGLVHKLNFAMLATPPSQLMCKCKNIMLNPERKT